MWYAPDLQELRALLDAPTRAEPYFQTALAHGFLHMPVAEFEFFADDDEFRSDGESPEGDEAMGPAEVAGQGLGGARGGEQNMLIKLLEVGGDFVQELMGLREAERAAPDATKLGILRNVMQYLQQCTSLAYFINVDAMFAVLPAAVRVDADKVRSTVAQLDFLNSVLPPGAGVLVYCSREPETLPAAGWCVPVVDTLFGLIAAQTDAPCPPALHEQAKVPCPLRLFPTSFRPSVRPCLGPSLLSSLPHPTPPNPPPRVPWQFHPLREGARHLKVFGGGGALIAQEGHHDGEGNREGGREGGMEIWWEG